jgi:uncharacterized DUF497 family protein
MQIEFDAEKRDRTLTERGLDFSRAGEVFSGTHLTRRDEKRDYGEERFVTAGRLDGRIVIMVWTPRLNVRRIISMRKANEREVKKLAPHLG